MERVRDWFLDRYGLAPDSTARHVRSARPLTLVATATISSDSLRSISSGVGVESVHAVPLTKGLEPLRVAFGSGYELNAGTVMEDLCPRVRYVRAADVLVIVELTLNVKLRCRSLNVVDCVSAPFVDNGDIGKHPHPAETDDAGAVFLYGAILT